jgi:hypothetical protein
VTWPKEKNQDTTHFFTFFFFALLQIRVRGYLQRCTQRLSP